MGQLFQAAALVAFGAFATAASAVPVQWTFDASPSISGNFIYDADTDTYSDISITTIGPFSGDLFGETYDDNSDVFAATPSILELAEIPLSVKLIFDSPLTNDGGSGLIVSVEEIDRSLFGSDEELNRDITASISGSPLTATPIPLPAASWLLVAALGGLVGLGARQTLRAA